MLRPTVTAVAVLGMVAVAGAVSIPGGGSKRNDCVVTLQAPGLGFPAEKTFKGTTCADGGPCDADGVVDGSCEFLVSFCLNTEGEGVPACGSAEVSSLEVSGKTKGGTLDLTDLQAAVDGLELPSSDPVCTAAAAVVVPVRGPDNKGELASGQAKLKSKAKTSRGTDKDKFQLVCRPSSSTATTTTSTVTTTSTTEPGATTTTSSSTTTTTPPGATPGAGLAVEILSADIDPSGVAHVTFSLTDAAGVPVTPQSASTDDPNKARVRFAIARLEVNPETAEVTTTFTRWQNYVLNASGMPAYDAGGAAAFVPAGPAGVWTYTFTTVLTLPTGYADLTHRVGAQVQRDYAGEALVGNPIFDFVPSGAAVTTERDVTSTAQCNQCHNPLQAHGTGRREVRLCQTCHTDQWTDPDSGFSIDFKNMIHRIHQGKDLPSVADGAVGARYGFGDTSFGEKVAACLGGALASLPCEVDADCPSGTCTGTTTVGVAFPKDIRNCTTCHAVTDESEQADNYLTLPSSLACTGCHDDVNPSEVPTDAGDAGWNHVEPGGDGFAFPDANCRLCHEPEGMEFDFSVPGAHVIPARSTELEGLVASIPSVEGTPDGPITLTFRVTNDAGTPVPSLTGFTIAFTTSGPTSDLGGASLPFVRETVAIAAVLGPDGEGNYSYTSTVTLPADASGTWRIGLEVRRPVTLSNGESVTEFAQNPIALFSVDGSPVEDRRVVVAQENCASCHGTFSVDFSIHGGSRNQVDYCVICHNANVTDFDRRRRAESVGADLVDEPIALKHLIHKIHRGEELEHHPYIVYGFGASPVNFTPHDFSEVLFPGDLRDCATCHVDDSQLLPLPAGLLPTIQSVVDSSSGSAVELPTGSIPVIQDACLSCHDADAAAAHAETMTTASGAEACNVCHEEGSLIPVSEAHAR